MLSVYGGAAQAGSTITPGRAAIVTDESHGGSGNYTAIEASRLVLEQEGRPVPTAHLVELLRPLGVTFGGKTPQNSLSSILSKSELFKTNGRAGWTLNKPLASVETKLADDPLPCKEVSPAIDEDPDLLVETVGPSPAQGREAGPGGGP